MKLKDRLREGTTTFIGLLFLLSAVGMTVMNIFFEKDFAAWSSIIPVALLGWVFLWAKNSILEGIFKVNEN